MTNRNEHNVTSRPMLNDNLFEKSSISNQQIYYSDDILEKMKKLQSMNEQLLKNMLILNSHMKEITNNHDQSRDQLWKHLNQQSDLLQIIDLQLSLLLLNENPFNELLSSLPPSYPMSKILVDGSLLNTSEFININTENGLAHFLDETQLITVQANKVSALIW